jgi:hypothetical protein
LARTRSEPVLSAAARGFANARGREIEEVVLVLGGGAGGRPESAA